jgi:hypothetical protein
MARRFVIACIVHAACRLFVCVRRALPGMRARIVRNRHGRSDRHRGRLGTLAGAQPGVDWVGRALH